MKKITISRTTNTIRVDGHETEFFMLESKYTYEKIVFIKAFDRSSRVSFDEQREIITAVEKQLKDDFDKMYNKDWIYKENWEPQYDTYVINFKTRK